MKRISILVFLMWIASVALAQITPVVSWGNSAVISYCSVPGYPSTPSPTAITWWFTADSITPCSGGAVTTIPDSGGNGYFATVNAGTITCSANQMNGHNAFSISGTPQVSVAPSPPVTNNNHNNVFSIFNPSSVSANATLIGSTSATNFQMRINSSAHQEVLAESTTSNLIGLLSVSANVWSQGLFYTPDDSHSILRLNMALDNANNSTFFNNGPSNVIFYNGQSNSEYYAGKISDLVYYASTTSNAIATYNECWMYNKMNLQPFKAPGSPTVRGYATAQTGGSSLAVTWPTGSLAGDTVIINIAGENVITAPTGWIVQRNGTAANWSQGATFSKVLSAADISTGSVTISASGNVLVACTISYVGPATIREITTNFANAATGSVSTTTSANVFTNEQLLIFGSARATSLPTSNLGTLQASTTATGGTGVGALYTFTATSGGAQTATFTYTGYNPQGYYQDIVGVSQ